MGFWGELRRRHIFRIAAVYAATAWLVLQLGAIVFPALHAPAWCLPVLIGFVALGFPVALVLAWAFEVTPEGVRRSEQADSEVARPVEHGRRVGRTLDFAIIAILAVAIGVLAWRLSMKPNAAVSTAASPGVAAPATAIPAKSVAVLPFANDSGNPDQRYFSDGLSDDLIIALSQYPGLKVIGRESSFQLRNTKLDSRQIGKKLGVAHILEGSVSHEGNEVRIRAELVNAADGATLWSHSYDRPYRNLFALQDDITRAVASALEAKLLGSSKAGAVAQSDRPPSGSLAAYNAYLEGNYYVSQFSEASLRKAVAAYRHAIDADPKYAAAYARLGYAWSILGGYFSKSRSAFAQDVASGRAAADTAIRLNPDLAAAYVARGRLLEITLDLRGSEAAYRRAATLDPASADARQWVARSAAVLGRLDEAIRLEREAVADNPLNAHAYADLAIYLAGDRRFEAATQAIKRAISLEPAAPRFQSTLAAIEVQRGNSDAALRAAQAEPDPSWHTWALALVYQAKGETTRAEEELHRFINDYAGNAEYQVAELYAYRGEPDQAFAWLDRAWRERDPGIGGILYDDFLHRYKNDPRFAALCRKLGLPTPEDIRQTSSPHQGTGA